MLHNILILKWWNVKYCPGVALKNHIKMSQILTIWRSSDNPTIKVRNGRIGKVFAVSDLETHISAALNSSISASVTFSQYIILYFVSKSSVCLFYLMSRCSATVLLQSKLVLFTYKEKGGNMWTHLSNHKWNTVVLSAGIGLMCFVNVTNGLF